MEVPQIVLPGEVNPIRNSSRYDSKPSGALDPALRGGTPYGAEPGIIIEGNPVAASGPKCLWPGGNSRGLFLTG